MNADCGLSAEGQACVRQRGRARHRRSHRGSADAGGRRGHRRGCRRATRCGRRQASGAASIAADLATAEGVETAIRVVLGSSARARHPHQQSRRRQLDAVRRDVGRDVGASFQVNLMGTVRTCRALVPAHGRARGGRGREHRVRSREAARARLHGLRLVQGRTAVSHQGARKAVRAGGARQHRAARSDLVAHVDAAGRHRRSARRSTTDSIATRR